MPGTTFMRGQFALAVHHRDSAFQSLKLPTGTAQMPRPKYGLGQGLEALVSTRQAHSGLHSGPSSPGSLTGDDAEAAHSPLVRWEYACLSIKRASKKRRVVLILSCPDTHVKPRTQRLR